MADLPKTAIAPIPCDSAAIARYKNLDIWRSLLRYSGFVQLSMASICVQLGQHFHLLGYLFVYKVQSLYRFCNSEWQREMDQMHMDIAANDLKVPTSFVSRHWQGMSNPVILSLPNGTESKVFWLNQDGGVWFCNGWKEFAKYSNMDVSHSIVFRYEGNSCFNVIIFGNSGLEIEYPLSRDATNEEVKEIDEDSYFPAKFSENEVRGQEKKYKKKKKKKNLTGIRHVLIIPSTRTVVMPAEFAKPYLHKEGSATLFVEHGRTWEVETKANSHGQLEVFVGWREFLLDNKLKLGDICAFEVLDRDLLLFKVTICPLE
ncbi:hypothetical protein VNO80_23812 [Phaseolus coccineus]|uniref:TF-B3 domain-containing protein n=1 Tax=Phaseolus coccineus TaxID=3886 RepID=A0AAN9QVW9_PHACN